MSSSSNKETLAPVGQAADEPSCNHGILVCESCGSTYCERCALHIEKSGHILNACPKCSKIRLLAPNEPY